ncbi:hypothetical protein GW796_08310 [archaeon]|nr:hypothetical protein [archaeon]
MSETKKLSYSFIRTEADGKYVIFFKISKELLEQDLDINLNEKHQLFIKTQSNQLFITKKLTDDIYDSLANRDTIAIFTDEDGEILSKQNLYALKSTLSVSKK